jgi:hypothetical protein
MTSIQQDQLWLIKTNQVWKVWIFTFLMFLGMISFIAMIMITNKVWEFDKINDIHFSLASILLIFGSLVWLSQMIKCPHCGHKPVWPIIRGVPFNEWFVKIARLKECLSCKK